jgi:hypothetical protein
MTIQIKQQIIKTTNEIYNEVTIKTAPYLVILFLTFMIIFGCTSITINAATSLSYNLLVILLITNQILLYFFLHDQRQYKIYMILLSVLITFAVIYIIYIKRIYDEEMKLIIQLKDKDILEDTNVTC